MFVYNTDLLHPGSLVSEKPHGDRISKQAETSPGTLSTTDALRRIMVKSLLLWLRALIQKAQEQAALHRSKIPCGICRSVSLLNIRRRTPVSEGAPFQHTEYTTTLRTQERFYLETFIIEKIRLL